MHPTRINISKIKLNPNNPRLIKDENFKKLVQSIKDFPEMLEIRPIVVNKDYIVLGGNMRYKACVEAGIKEVPVIITNLSEDKQREFLIKDNISGGDWDWNILANEWDEIQLTEWGLDIPGFEDEEIKEREVDSLGQAWFLNIEFQNEKDCETWYNKLIKEGLICKIVQ